MSEPTGEAGSLGSLPEAGGTRFRLFSGCAEAVELCLYDSLGRERARHWLDRHDNDLWEAHIPGCGPGQRYGFRVHGPYDPAAGLRCNPAKLLLDPYARKLAGSFRWSPAVFGHEPENPDEISHLDSAPFVPKSVVTAPQPAPRSTPPGRPWSESIVYELNLRGFTMRHPALNEAERGTVRGLRSGASVAYLKSLGITAVELLPVFSFIDEQRLREQGLRNFWGYNSIAFFAPAQRYLGGEGLAGFRSMIDTLHDAGIEVILDVPYNHTGESDAAGPTLCFRGIDNRAYYRLDPRNPARYANDTGCGNTLNADHPRVQDLVVDSLRYWVGSFGVDGFRFDLATVLGRQEGVFRSDHPLLRRIASDPTLAGTKLIAEPWDVGPDGYRLGEFPPPFAEWNDRYRDAVRRFWAGEDGLAGELARRLHGSADRFESAGRGPWASINYVTCHDGFTLADLVSYSARHNHANGEGNRDGQRHNYNRNFGAEGPTDEPRINALRRRQRLNLLATLLLSQGTPMLLAGDEFGNSQGGNNNAYAQDNDIGWLDWTGRCGERAFLNQVRRLIRLRRRMPLFRRPRYAHGRMVDGRPDIAWLAPSGAPMGDGEWAHARALMVVLFGPSNGAAILLNAAAEDRIFHEPALSAGEHWRCVFASDGDQPASVADGLRRLPALSIACLAVSAR